MRGSETDAVVETYLKSVNYIGSRFSLQKYRFRNYTADLQVSKGYLQSSLGAACVSRYEVAYPEPDKEAFMNGKPFRNEQLIQLLKKPNPWMTETDFDRFTIKYQLMTGNCYWIKMRNGKRGPVTGLFPFNDMNVTPVGTEQSFIAYYKFVTFDGEVTEYAPEDIIHLPWVYINPLYPNRGIGPGALAAREIDTDSEFGQFLAAYMANNGSPGGIIKVAKDALAGAAGISETTAKKLKSSWREKFTGKGQGDIAILEPGFEYQQVGTSMKDLDLSNSRATPEARTCALYLIPPEVVGVNVGMAHSTENNLAESRIRWVNSSLVPLWVQNGKKLSAGFQDEYPGVEIKYNIETVAAIKEQRQKQLSNQSTALYQWVQAYCAGTVDPDAARNAATYLFGLSDEDAKNIFPKLPPRSEQSVDANGNLVGAGNNQGNE